MQRERAKPVVIDERSKYGRFPETMGLPSINGMDFGEPIPVDREVLYLGVNGWDGDAPRANLYLKPGKIYRAAFVRVNQSSSTVEVAEFPGVEFNTVMFVDWPESTDAGATTQPAASPATIPPPVLSDEELWAAYAPVATRMWPQDDVGSPSEKRLACLRAVADLAVERARPRISARVLADVRRGEWNEFARILREAGVVVEDAQTGDTP